MIAMNRCADRELTGLALEQERLDGTCTVLLALCSSCKEEEFASGTTHLSKEAAKHCDSLQDHRWAPLGTPQWHTLQQPDVMEWKTG